MSVNVLPHWYKRAKLQIELTHENIELFLKKSVQASAGANGREFKPVLPTGIYWNKVRHAAYVWYCDANGRWHTRTLVISKDGDTDDIQHSADLVAMDLSKFYEDHHCSNPEPVADAVAE